MLAQALQALLQRTIFCAPLQLPLGAARRLVPAVFDTEQLRDCDVDVRLEVDIVVLVVDGDDDELDDR